MAVHFVGFRTTGQFHQAAQAFGHPDFIHQRYDHRAVGDITPDDVVVFATGDDTQTPCRYSYDDSSFF